MKNPYQDIAPQFPLFQHNTSKLGRLKWTHMNCLAGIRPHGNLEDTIHSFGTLMMHARFAVMDTMKDVSK